jgi:EAL domain-containing protein (putative c-di-GMP-specific phosphodiesterase class I)/DNA-binding NarL/FixJ family response regulator/HPt (histidine-containing phosphotransfer) domain-containing protein
MQRRLEATHAATDATPVLDSNVIASIRELGGETATGEDDIVRLVSLFVEDARTRAVELAAAAASGDVLKTRAVSHSLAGSSATIGAARLAEICRMIESTARTGRIVPASSIADARATLQHTVEELTEIFPGLTPDTVEEWSDHQALRHPSNMTSLAALTAAIDRALEHDEFTLAYQPKVSLTTNRIVGFEALIRWTTPSGETIAPNDFIPVAEASGRILRIGEWVLEGACRQLADWQRAYPTMALTMSVNVSARQFSRRLVSAVRSAIDSTGVAAADVWLELTETTVMDDVDASLAVLDRLRSIGVNISLDDFGTGHSSLAYLHRMAIDELKIDRSFVHGLGANSVDTAIVASVVSLAHAMGCDVIAEGVETAAQLNRLRNLGCDSVQGYLLARPLAAVDIDAYLAADVAGARWPRRSESYAGEPSVADQSVLIVDDAADIRMMATMALSAAGFVTHEAGTAAAAIALATRIKPDYVVLDITMPDMSGIDVCRTLRANADLARSTIVMVSNLSEGTSKAEAFLLGADDYLVKPFTPRDLVARLNAAARRRREMPADPAPVDPALTEMLAVAQARAAAQTGPSLADNNFSERQLEIIQRLIRGERVPTIARGLYLSQSTVRNHLSAIFRKLGVHSQEELLASLRKG